MSKQLWLSVETFSGVYKCSDFDRRHS